MCTNFQVKGHQIDHEDVIRVWTTVMPFLPDRQGTLLASYNVCSTSHHRYTKVRPRHVTLVAWRVALSWHPRTRPLQAGSNSTPMSAWQGLQVPGRLLHTSLRHCQHGRHLRSASRHHLSHRLSTFGRRAFSIAGRTVWNSLPDSLDPALSNDRFWQLLKTNLFRRYPCTEYAQRSRDASWLCAI